MADYNNIKNKLSQPYYLIIACLVIFFFSALLLVDASVNVKLIIGLFLAFLPVFFIKPVTFLYFIFLLTPSLRTIAKTDIIWQTSDFVVNFNVLIDFFTIFFGLILILDHWPKTTWLIKKNKFVSLFFLFIALIAASTVYSINKQNTVEELIRICSIGILFLYSFLVIKDKKTFFKLLLAIIIGTLLPAAFALYQLITASGWYDKTILEARINGTFLHPATFAFYLLFTLPILYSLLQNESKRKNKFILALTTAFFIFLIIASLTRGAWLGLLVMLIAYGLIKSRKFLAGVVIIILLAYFFFPAVHDRVVDIANPKYNSSFTTRLLIIKSTLPAFYTNPILGNGFGTFGDIHLKYNPEAITYESLQAHNDYLRILIELGGLGLTIYLLLFASLFWRFFSLYRKTEDTFLKNHLFSLIILWLGALAVATGDNLLRTMEVQYLLWAYTGAVLALANNKALLLKEGGEVKNNG